MSSKCGTHHYGNITQKKIDEMISALKSHNATVKGNNPWDINVHSHGVKLRASWDKNSQILSIIVTDKDFYVPCSKIWDNIDPLIHHISLLDENDIV